MIGRTIAHYEITAALGAGGMGAVYRATDTRLGREVALKVLPDAMAADPARLARFQREAKALAALDHPGIVTVHAVEEADGIHFLTMQLVEGRSLDDLIAGGALPAAQIRTIGGAIADALAAAHAMDSQWLGWLGHDRVFEPLRGEPRFTALLRKIGLAD